MLFSVFQQILDFGGINMNIKLYPCFEHWKTFQQIWIISDFHFNDPDSKFFRKDYPGDLEFVSNINKKCGKNDLLICLGDVGDIEFVKKIRAGRKILIMGNHDTGANNYRRKLENGADNHLFDEVYEGPAIINEKIILSHEPILNCPYLFNIHGHVHESRAILPGLWNCCAEHLNYAPISLKTIIKSGKLKEVSSIHRLTIDNAAKRSLRK